MVKKAVALKYEPGKDAAPRVTAKGRGVIAERIVELAKKHGIHVEEDPELADVLYRLDINEEIPQHLYRAVAEILAFVYKKKKAWKYL